VSQIAGLVASTLDELAVTDRVYHHLNASSPLIIEILARIVRRPRLDGPLLLIGGNALLAHVLVRMGFDVEIWFFREGFLTDELEPVVSRYVTTAELASGDVCLKSRHYSTIVLPLLLECLPNSPDRLLAGLRAALTPDGQLLIATTSMSRLEVRLAALSGKNLAPTASRPPQVSLSWPALPKTREYHRDDLIPLCREAGFQIQECKYVTSAKPFVALDSFGLPVYAGHKLQQGVKQLIPSARDVILLDLTPGSGEPTASGDRFRRQVSVIVSASRGGTSLARALQALENQTYPAELYEVIVLHNSRSPESLAVLHGVERSGARRVRGLHVEHPEGPLARNQAMAEAVGEICAHTDDASEVPPDWIQGAVGWFDDQTAVVSGSVFAREGSVPRYMDPPASRADGDDKGVFPKGLFPIANVFYRRSTALSLGGFDEAFCAQANGDCLGWDTELAWRIRNQGWATTFREDVYVFRHFSTPDHLRWLPRHWHQARHLPQIVAEVEPLGKDLLTARVFASSNTLFFDLLLASFTLAVLRRRLRYIVLGLPWFLAVGQRLDLWPPSQWRGSARLLAARGLRHLTWLGGYLYGSVRAGRLVL
jgi:hypothetical protein